MARFEWTQLSLDNFDESVGVLISKLKACLDEIDGVKDEDQDGTVIALFKNIYIA